MQLYIDVDLNQLVLNPGNKNPVTSLSFKRGDSAQINVQFVQAGAVIELPADATGKIGFKKIGKYDDDFIVSALGWTKNGTGATASYAFSPSFNTTQLNALLDQNGDPVASVQLMGEIQWATGGATESTNTFTATVSNDVIKDDEGVPTAGTPPYPIPSLLLTTALVGIVALNVGQQDYVVDISALNLEAPPRGLVVSVVTDGATSPQVDAHMVRGGTTAASVAIHLAQAPTLPNQQVAYLLIV